MPYHRLEDGKSVPVQIAASEVGDLMDELGCESYWKPSGREKPRLTGCVAMSNTEGTMEDTIEMERMVEWLPGARIESEPVNSQRDLTWGNERDRERESVMEDGCTRQANPRFSVIKLAWNRALDISLKGVEKDRCKRGTEFTWKGVQGVQGGVNAALRGTMASHEQARTHVTGIKGLQNLPACETGPPGPLGTTHAGSYWSAFPPCS